jgi:hypothetical protein
LEQSTEQLAAALSLDSEELRVGVSRALVSRAGDGWLIFKEAFPGTFRSMTVTQEAVILLSTSDTAAEQRIREILGLLIRALDQAGFAFSKASSLVLKVGGQEFYCLSLTTTDNVATG